MTLRQQQSIFSMDIVRFLNWAISKNLEFTFGEAQRPLQMQEIYVKTGRSKTMNSKHLEKLAFDLFFFKDGKLLASKEEMQFIGDYWESLSEHNSWGGNWNSFKDVPHFERRV